MPLDRRNDPKIEHSVVAEDCPDQRPVTIRPVSQVMHEKGHQKETDDDGHRHPEDSESRAVDYLAKMFHVYGTEACAARLTTLTGRGEQPRPERPRLLSGYSTNIGDKP